MTEKHPNPTSMTDRSRVGSLLAVSIVVAGARSSSCARGDCGDRSRAVWRLSCSGAALGCRFVRGALSRSSLVGPGQRPCLATRRSRISAITDAVTVLPNAHPGRGRSVGHFSRAAPGQFSRASKSARVVAELAVAASQLARVGDGGTELAAAALAMLVVAVLVAARRGYLAKRRGPDPASSAPDGAQMTGSQVLRLVEDPSSDVERSGVQRDVAEPLHAVADPVAAELEAALALRRTGADAKALRRALRRIEELLDE
jgi:hypothetical protein